MFHGKLFIYRAVVVTKYVTTKATPPRQKSKRGCFLFYIPMLRFQHKLTHQNLNIDHRSRILEEVSDIS